MITRNTLPASDADTDVLVDGSNDTEVEETLLSNKDDATKCGNEPGHYAEATLDEFFEAMRSDEDDDPVMESFDEEEPDLDFPSDDILLGLKTEEEARQLGMDRGHKNGVIARWLAAGSGRVADVSRAINQKEQDVAELRAQIKAQPSEIRINVWQPEWWVNKEQVFHWGSTITGGIAFLFGLGSVLVILGHEYVFELFAVIGSSLGLGLNPIGAAGMVFGMCVGAFAALCLWLYTQEHKVHEATRRVGTKALQLAITTIVLVGAFVGTGYLGEGQWFTPEMLIIPLIAGLLVCAAIGPKMIIVHVLANAFPPQFEEDTQLTGQRENIDEDEQDISELKCQLEYGKQLVVRAESVIKESSSRIVGRWRVLKHRETIKAQARTAKQNRIKAEAVEKLAENDLENLDKDNMDEAA